MYSNPWHPKYLQAELATPFQHNNIPLMRSFYQRSTALRWGLSKYLTYKDTNFSPARSTQQNYFQSWKPNVIFLLLIWTKLIQKKRYNSEPGTILFPVLLFLRLTQWQSLEIWEFKISKGKGGKTLINKVWIRIRDFLTPPLSHNISPDP